MASLQIISRVALVIFEAIKNKKVPGWLELIALSFGLIGAFILILPKTWFINEEND